MVLLRTLFARFQRKVGRVITHEVGGLINVIFHDTPIIPEMKRARYGAFRKAQIRLFIAISRNFLWFLTRKSKNIEAILRELLCDYACAIPNRQSARRPKSANSPRWRKIATKKNLGDREASEV